MTVIIGIDPGKSGGIAWAWFGTADVHAVAIKMPATEKDISDTFSELADVNAHAYIEKVGAMPGQGVTSMFSFGRNYGFLRGCLIAHGIPFDDVTPQKWLGSFGLKRKKNETGTAWKNRQKGHAQQLFPGLAITHATANALQIMEYGRRLRIKVEHA